VSAEVKVEDLAKILHQAGSRYAPKFEGWDDVTEAVRNGRRQEARYLMARLVIVPRPPIGRRHESMPNPDCSACHGSGVVGGFNNSKGDCSCWKSQAPKGGNPCE